jgi:hypothetical protein
MTGYDSKTAVTFLLIGLGVGALLSLFFSPGKQERIPGARKDLSKEIGVTRISA